MNGGLYGFLICLRRMEAYSGKIIAETEDEVWKLMELQAKLAHDEDANRCDDEIRAY